MNFTCSFPEPEIALLSLDCPGRSANVLSREVMAELADRLSQLRSQSNLRGLVIASGKPGGFALGADLREMRSASQAGSSADPAELSRSGQQILRELCEWPLVSVAVIDGLCLGGGAELACWCDARVMSTNPRSQIGLPEVKLGLIPGWGGTSTLPRRVGLSHAVRMIASGEPVEPEQALAMGLVDEVVRPENLLAAAICAIRWRLDGTQFLTWADERKQFQGPLGISEPERELLALGELQTLARDGRSSRLAPQTAIRLMISAAVLPLEAALQQETAAFAPLRTSAEHQALLYSYFLTDYAKRAATTAAGTAVPASSGTLGSVQPAMPLSSLAIIGAGVMGGGIAAAALGGGLDVTLCDARPEALATAAREVVEEAAYDRRLRGPNPEQVLRISSKLRTVGQISHLAGVPAVIEAIAENLSAKQQLYAELEPLLPETALLASNTSTLPITQLAGTLKHPERFCGMHFFNPVRRMKLLEIVRGEQTSDTTITAALSLARQLGKLPIVVRDGPGFAVNRMLSPYLNESLALLHDGLSIEQVDAAAIAFGMPLGPLAIYDLVGLDVAIDCGKTFYQAFPDRAMPSPILRSLIRSGRLGRKQGGGFYRYDTKAGAPQRDPAAEKIVEGYRKRDRELTTEQIQDRLLFAMLTEAARVLEEGRVRDPRDLDLGVTLGLGFPETKGGILYWADTLGGAEILRRLEPLRCLGAQFEPPQLLLDVAKSGRKLVADLGR